MNLVELLKSIKGYEKGIYDAIYNQTDKVVNRPIYYILINFKRRLYGHELKRNNYIGTAILAYDINHIIEHIYERYTPSPESLQRMRAHHPNHSYNGGIFTKEINKENEIKNPVVYDRTDLYAFRRLRDTGQSPKLVIYNTNDHVIVSTEKINLGRYESRTDKVLCTHIMAPKLEMNIVTLDEFSTEYEILEEANKGKNYYVLSNDYGRLRAKLDKVKD